MTRYESMASWITHLAVQKGWWQYAKHRAAQLERSDPVTFTGLLQDVARRLAKAGFEPSSNDLEKM